MVFPIAGGNESKGYEISNSLRFNDGDSPSLARTPSSEGNRDTFTISFWLRPDEIVTDGFAIGWKSGAHDRFEFGMRDVDQVFFGVASNEFKSSWKDMNDAVVGENANDGFTAAEMNELFDGGTNWKTDGTWYHIALERSGTTLKVYIDGTSVISVSASTTALQASEDPFRVGVFNDASTGSPSLDWYFNGHIDDLRITKGIARYGTNFTPPTSAHETTGGDGNLPVVLDADATGVRVDYDGSTNQARIAHAWCNWDGTQAAASMIDGSYNISSITDSGTGDYTLNFSTAASDANFAATSCGIGTTNQSDVLCRPSSASAVRHLSRHNGSAYDNPDAAIIVFGN